jgi:hypothetical protein
LLTSRAVAGSPAAVARFLVAALLRDHTRRRVASVGYQGLNSSPNACLVFSRLVNFFTSFWPGRLFQISNKREAGHFPASWFSCFALVKR